MVQNAWEKITGNLRFVENCNYPDINWKEKTHGEDTFWTTWGTKWAHSEK